MLLIERVTSLFHTGIETVAHREKFIEHTDFCIIVTQDAKSRHLKIIQEKNVQEISLQISCDTDDQRFPCVLGLLNSNTVVEVPSIITILTIERLDTKEILGRFDLLNGEWLD